MSAEEQRLADLLKRAVPEPPRELTHEEVTVPHVNRPRKSWLMPTLAAAAVVAIGVTLGVAATHLSGPGTASFQPAGGSSSASALPSASASPSACASGNSRAGVTVPDLVGQEVPVAVASLQKLGFDVVVASQQASTAPQGTVARQSPAAGTTVARGSVATLFVSGATGAGASGAPISQTPVPTTPTCPPAPTGAPTGSPKTPSAHVVPSVIGQTSAQATAALVAAGFTVTLQAQAAPRAQSLPQGIVWAQSSAPGAEEPRGATITLDYQPKS